MTNKLLVFISFVALLSACSTKVNKFTNRTYHQTTTRFNVLFNGQQSLFSAQQALLESQEQDYDSLWGLFLYPKDTNEVSSIKEHLEKAVKKGEKAIQRHSMYIKRKERNKYIDEAYMLIAKAKLYSLNYKKAEEVFNYLGRAYKKQEEGKLAKIWKAHVLTEKNKTSQAYDIFKDLDEDLKTLGAPTKQFYYKSFAHLNIKEGDYEKAIEHLEKAIKFTKKKQEKIHLHFLIAQLYQAENNVSSAATYFDKVLDLKPHYDLMLNTKLQKAGGNLGSAESEKELLDLLKKAPSGDAKSQILGSLAQIQLNKGKENKALEYMKASANEAKKASSKKKAFLQLAKFHFNKTHFEQSKLYYDSTLLHVQSSDPNHTNLQETRNTLARLVKNLQVIALQDSLINLAQMSEEDRISAIQQQIKKDEAQKEALALQKQNELDNKLNSVTSNTAPLTASLDKKNDWYFLNTTTLEFGRTDFLKIWGERKLEDHWRRTEKSAFFSQDQSDLQEDDLTNNNEFKRYLKDIPLTDKQMASSTKSLTESLYDLGIVYKEKLDQPKKALQLGFDRIVFEHDTSKLAASSAYFCYLIAKEDASLNAEKYRKIILDKYAETEYAKIVLNPNYFAEKKASALSVQPLYKKAYLLYKEKNYTESLTQIEYALKQYPKTELKPKLLLLASYNKKDLFDQAGFKNTLQELVKSHPKTEQGELAQKLLQQKSDFFTPKSLDYKIKGQNDSLYTIEDSLNLNFIVAIPKSNNLNLKIFETKLNVFNKKYFKASNLSVSELPFKNKYLFLKAETFSSLKLALEYHQSFLDNKNILKNLNDKGFYSFIISQNNLNTLLTQESIEPYNVFYLSEIKK